MGGDFLNEEAKAPVESAKKGTEVVAMKNGRLKLDDTVEQSIVKMCEGNPGAMTVLVELFKREDGVLDVARLDDLGLYGPAIWLAFKDFSGENLDKLVDNIRNNKEAMVAFVKERM